jgi:mRNA interferase RelE/StbE
MSRAPRPVYEVIIHPKAEDDLRRLPPSEACRVLRSALDLGDDPFPGGKKVKRLAGVRPVTHRLRVGDYRALYRVHEATRRVFLLRVVTRGDLSRAIARLPRTPP